MYEADQFTHSFTYTNESKGERGAARKRGERGRDRYLNLLLDFHDAQCIRTNCYSSIHNTRALWAIAIWNYLHLQYYKQKQCIQIIVTTYTAQKNELDWNEDLQVFVTYKSAPFLFIFFPARWHTQSLLYFKLQPFSFC